jgi:hypothetical protein
MLENFRRLVAPAATWVFDVAFDEDSCRVRKDNAPENMAMLRHIALNLLKDGTSMRLPRCWTDADGAPPSAPLVGEVASAARGPG